MSSRPVSFHKLEEDAYYAVLRALAVNELDWVRSHSDWPRSLRTLAGHGFPSRPWPAGQLVREQKTAKNREADCSSHGWGEEEAARERKEPKSVRWQEIGGKQHWLCRTRRSC